MAKQILITGGARSGKSTYAQEIVTTLGQQIGYIATAVITDTDMADRILKHQLSRPAQWVTLECYKDFHLLPNHPDFLQIDTFLLDCVTILMTNLMFDQPLDYDTATMAEVDQVEHHILAEINQLLDVMSTHHKNLILVTNEVGLGLVPAYRLGNLFRDISGRINQLIAKRCDEVYFVVSGIPVKIK